jgi:hypothetical protein
LDADHAEYHVENDRCNQRVANPKQYRPHEMSAEGATLNSQIQNVCGLCRAFSAPYYSESDPGLTAGLLTAGPYS